MSNSQTQGQIDQNKLNQMKVHVLTLERKNINTGQESNDDMVKLIQQSIISIANKAF